MVIHWSGNHRPWAVVIAVILGLELITPLAAIPAGHALESSLTSDLQGAQSDLQRGLTQLEDGYRKEDAKSVQAAVTSFTRSRDRLEAFSRRLGPANALARAPVPPLRSRVTTLDAVIDMAGHLNRAGIIGAQALLASGLVSSSAVGTPISTSELINQLASIRDELTAADTASESVDVSVLPSAQRVTLTNALAELRAAVAGLAALWPSIDAVFDMIGLNGPRTYLIEQTNPAELRSGGGFIGTISLVHADRGHVTLAQSLPVEAFDYCDASGCVHPRPYPGQPGYVAPPAELAGPPLPSFSRLTAWSLEDSGFYPDFADNARLAATFARKLLNTPIDGVVAIDYYAVAPLLDLTGPIELPKYKLTLTADNFVDTVVGQDLARDYAHKDVISAAAAEIVAGLAHLPPGDLPKLVKTVQTMVQGRHLQLYFDQPVVESQLGRVGATDTLNPRRATDFLLETEDNYGGSKANYFIDRRFKLDLAQTGSVLHHKLTIDLHDGAPADKQYIGPHYYAYLRITVPAGATHVTVSSSPSAEYDPIEAPARRTQVAPAGAQVAGGWIFIMVGPEYTGNYEASLSWDTPWTPNGDGEATLDWQKQPGTVRDSVEVTWTPAGGHASTARTDLSVDRLVTLGPDGVQLSAAAPPGS